MGKPDTRQPRLNFDKKSPKPPEGDSSTQDQAEGDNSEYTSADDIWAMFRDLKTSLQAIDSKID